jgi:PAS domain S-box-containing protein
MERTLKRDLISERRRLASFPQLNPNPVIELDQSSRIVFANKASKKSLRESGLSTNLDFFIPSDINSIIAKLKAKKSSHFQREITIGKKTFSESISLVPGFETVRIYATDISKRVTVERTLQKLNEDLEKIVSQRTTELVRYNRAMSMLSACNVVLVHARDEKKLLCDICRIIVTTGGYKLAWVGSAEKDAKKSVLPLAQIGFEEGYLEKANISWSQNTLRGRGPTGQAIREREIKLGRYFSADPKLAPWRKEALKRGYASSIALPLEAQNNLFGALMIYSADPQAFDKKEVSLLKELADDLAFGISSLRINESHKKARKHLLATNKLLTISNHSLSREAYLDSVTRYVKKLSQCCCVGVRILDKQGFIPYDAYVGFDQDFYQSENQLSLDKDQCACIRVIAGKPEKKDLSAMTPFGSFYTGDSLNYVSGLSEKDRLKFRGKCVRCGFSSIAIIPIRSKENIIGAIHIADKKREALSLKKVEFIESLIPFIGEGIVKFNVSDQLRESEKKYRELVENANSIIVRLDTKGCIIFFNEFAEKFFGFRKEEVIGRNSVGTIIPETELSGRNLAAMMKDIIKNPERYTKNENENIKKNGERVWVLWRNRAIFDKDGKLLEILSIGSDITERKAKEEQLLESYQHLGTINRKISFLSELSQLTARYRGKKKIILERMLGPLVNFSVASFGALFRYEEKKGSAFRMLSFSGVREHTQAKIRSIGENNKRLRGILMRNQECLRGYCRDLPLGKFSHDKQLKYGMLIPLKRDKKLEAFIFLGFKNKQDFSNQDLEFFNVFSIYVSALLADAKVFK